MSLAVRSLPAQASISWDDALRNCARALLFVAIGVELMILVAWVPDTLQVWFRPETAGYGDFPIFYRAAQSFHLNATYSPGLAVLMHPLTYLGMQRAFLVYTGVNVAALLAIAYVAQRGVSSFEAKAAVALGVLALPQTHWAIRAGHFTEVLALAALLGLLLADRRPVIAGLLIGVLALKPQYLPVPLLYFAFAHNWRALASSVGALAGLALLGVVAAMVVMGTDVAGYIARYYAEAVPYIAQNLTAGQQDGFYVHAWQYSWYGFLVSAGMDANPLIAGELLLVSLGAVLLVWWKCSPSVAKVAVVLGMLLLTPHSTFYNWSMIAAAGALLLRSDLRPRWLIPSMIGGLALAMVATQNATPFPLLVDRFRPPETRGLYWVQPAALLALFALAIAGRSKPVPLDEPPPPAKANGLARQRQLLSAPTWTTLQLATVGLMAIVLGYSGGAYVGDAGPFASGPLYGRSQVLQALPSDFPVPEGGRVAAAGTGTTLPYRIEWSTSRPVNEVAGAMRARLEDGSWHIFGAADDDGSTLRVVRTADGDHTASVGEVDVVASGAGSRVRLEFSPLPSSTVPHYQRWLEGIGLVVHNVDQTTQLPDLVPSH